MMYNYFINGRIYGKLLVFLVILNGSVIPLLAQSRNTISGTVTDTDGEPIIGATVRINGTQFGTATDIDGRYEFSAELNPGDYTMLVSSIGYSSRQVTISLAGDGALTQDVMLNIDILNLDQVVVTGSSAATTRKQLGNAINTVSAREIEHTGSGNPLAALSGRVLGAQITQNQGNAGGGFSVRLRGASTISGSSEPLYIVDGVIVDNSSQNVINLNADAMGTNFAAGQNRLVDLNPNDIDRIEVINGAAAAAIYGSRASNGVVQIFTKRGSEGAPSVTVSTSFSASSVRKRLEFNTFSQRFGIPGSDRLRTVQDRLTTIADLRDADDRAANPGTGPAALAGRPLVEETYGVTRYDYQDLIFQTAIGTDNYVSIRGGGANTKYFGSASYSFNEGIITNTSFQKYGARLRVEQTFNDVLKVSAGLVYNNSFSNDRPNGNNFFSPISTMTIIDNVWDATERDQNGNLLGVEPVRLNPLSVIEEFDITQETNRVITDLQVNYNPSEEWSFNYIIGFDTYSLVGNTFQPRVPYAPVAAGFFPDGYASVATSNIFQVNHDLNVVFSKSFGDITSATTVGGQLQYDKSAFSAIEGRDLSNFVKTTEAINNQFNLPREFNSERSIWGYFLQETIGYKDFAFVTFSGRIDGASSFGEDERNQFYPKASGSLVFSELAGWQGAGVSSLLNTFKLRASWGKAGNLTAIGAFDRNTVYEPISLTGRGGFIKSSGLGDPGIKPEIMTEFEAGADFAFLKGRLGLQFSYYTQDIEDLIIDRNLAPTQGGASVLTNIGGMTNEGIEFKLSGTPVKTSNFQWDASLLFNTFNNEVSGIGGGRAGVTLRGGGGTQSAIDGEALGVFFARYYARNNDGSLLLTPDGLPQVERGDDETGTPMRDDNGQPTGDPLRKILGDPNPDYTWTLVNEFKYNKLSLRVQFDAIQGFDVYNWDKITRNNVGSSKLAEQEIRGELPRGWVAAIGGFIGPRIQEEHVEDGSFIKLREIALNYDIGSVAGFKNLKVTLVGRNLISFDNYTGFDPETNSAGQSNRVRGDDFGNVPIPRMYQVKFTANF
ncbi:MAG: SusC/RagA family TonB-linked outer membrane protein [Ekhidna sp.]|nr:SusC/RagA family TonB-linked outer membrane protein [Ekhidna sp.]